MLLRYFVVTQTKLFQTFNIGTNITANPFKDKKFYSGIVVKFDSGRGGAQAEGGLEALA